MSGRRTKQDRKIITQLDLQPNEAVIPEINMMEILGQELQSLDRMLSDFGYAMDKCKPYGGFGEVRSSIFLAERVVLVGCALGDEIRKLREAIEAKGGK